MAAITNNKYQQGKIYRITDNSYTKCYYGSTTRNLNVRMKEHCFRYSRCKAKEIIDEFGIVNCKIELIEAFPCNSKSELEQRERFYIHSNDCVNRNMTKKRKRDE